MTGFFSSCSPLPMELEGCSGGVKTVLDEAVSCALLDKQEAICVSLLVSEESSSRLHLLFCGCSRLAAGLFSPLPSVLVKAVEVELMDLKPDT